MYCDALAIPCDVLCDTVRCSLRYPDPVSHTRIPLQVSWTHVFKWPRNRTRWNAFPGKFLFARRSISVFYFFNDSIGYLFQTCFCLLFLYIPNRYIGYCEIYFRNFRCLTNYMWHGCFTYCLSLQPYLSNFSSTLPSVMVWICPFTTILIDRPLVHVFIVWSIIVLIL